LQTLGSNWRGDGRHAMGGCFRVRPPARSGTTAGVACRQRGHSACGASDGEIPSGPGRNPLRLQFCHAATRVRYDFPVVVFSSQHRPQEAAVKIKEIETFFLDVPFHEIPDRNMSRNNWDWRIVEICRVTLDNGVVGLGETLPNYTWSRVSPDAIERAKGQNPFAILYDDSLGAGLQMAIFDACGKVVEVP